MTDDIRIRQPEDPTKINVNQSWELEYWSNKFGVTKDKVKQAVAAVGPMVVDVEKWLKKH